MNAAVFTELARQGYDELQGWNASLLKVAITRSPAHAWAAFRDPNRPAGKDSAAFRIGTMLHQALLEPEAWEQLQPCSHGSTTKAFKEAVAKAAEDGRTLVQAGEHELASAMATSIRRHAVLGNLFTAEHRRLNELTLHWADQVTGHQCKARLDAVRISAEEITILDLKTTVDAGLLEFGRSAASFGYILQAAFYADGLFHCARALEAAIGLAEGELIGRSIAFEFVAVEKEPPHLVARYRLTTDQAAMGRRLYRRALELVTAADELDYWPGYDIASQPLELPNWAWQSMERLLSDDQ